MEEQGIYTYSSHRPNTISLDNINSKNYREDLLESVNLSENNNKFGSNDLKSEKKESDNKNNDNKNKIDNSDNDKVKNPNKKNNSAYFSFTATPRTEIKNSKQLNTPTNSILIKSNKNNDSTTLDENQVADSNFITTPGKTSIKTPNKSKTENSFFRNYSFHSKSHSHTPSSIKIGPTTPSNPDNGDNGYNNFDDNLNLRTNLSMPNSPQVAFSSSPNDLPIRTVPAAYSRKQTFSAWTNKKLKQNRIPLPRRSTYAGSDVKKITNSSDRRFSVFNPNNDTKKKWQDFKRGFERMLLHRRKAANAHYYKKSTELVTEISAGIPASIILATYFQPNQKSNHRRLPILLEQLNYKMTPEHSAHILTKSLQFRIDLEYGSGLTRVNWTIYRDLRDFLTLHSRAKLHELPLHGASNYLSRKKLPSFPRVLLPLSEKWLEDEANSLRASFDVQESNGHEHSNEKVYPYKKNDNKIDPEKAELYCTNLDHYLKELIGYSMFSISTNIVCRFLEISRLSLRLAGENGYHGKEGNLVIKSSSRSAGWRSKHYRPQDFKSMFLRHTKKWFLVRESYIVCIAGIEELTPLEVFLVDPEFTVDSSKKVADALPDELDESIESSHKFKYSFKITNKERELDLLARSHKVVTQWVSSIQIMLKNTLWSQPHRFESFAPIRHNVCAQYYVDARDYFWDLSIALDMAQDVIYIHDWWLSPELYLRRPAYGNQKWRIDRILKRKAEQGVKIFVIIYRNVGNTIPIDSMYTKHSLIDLHENIYVIRSPNQLLQATFFWAHHEKLCIIDHSIAFLGGLDLCFGRWDTPQHIITDTFMENVQYANENENMDSSNKSYNIAKNNPDSVDKKFLTLWPGKDYSNARVRDFHTLDRPYEDLYDRNFVPRMPWHDVHLRTVGQIARDFSRHFVQRWNYLIRQKRPSRYTPLLLPPSDFTEMELKALGFEGTCEVQALRSACTWSLGLKPDKYEKSIQNAYLKSIESSEHFVYIENQFFVTSTLMDGIVIENQIGNALVERIIRAYEKDEDWRAVILIPLMPGFESNVDEQDGSSVRLIMQCQYRSICRGKHSIFTKLRNYGIEPSDYIHFFSLRKWGILGPQKVYVTEQLYIHAKCMIVDDRIAIIGSANINERSMRGVRDSEIAVIVRDRDQIQSTMAGKPYMVARFAHNLRLRLMREHLGIDVDELEAIHNEIIINMTEKAKDTNYGEEKVENNDIGKEMVDNNKEIVTNPNENLLKNECKNDFNDLNSEKDLRTKTKNKRRSSLPGNNSIDNMTRPKNLLRSFSTSGVNLTSNNKAVKRNSTFSEADADNNTLNLLDNYSVSSESTNPELEKQIDIIEENIAKAHTFIHSFNHEAGSGNKGLRDVKALSADNRIQGNSKHKEDVDGLGVDKMKYDEKAEKSFHQYIEKNRQTKGLLWNEKAKEIILSETQNGNTKSNNPNDINKNSGQVSKNVEKFNNEPLDSNNDKAIFGPNGFKISTPSHDSILNSNVLISNEQPIPKDHDTNVEASTFCTNDSNANIRREKSREILVAEMILGNEKIQVDPNSFIDPLDDKFYYDTWLAIAERNTEVFRLVFRCQPDNEVLTWKDYKSFIAYSSRFRKAQCDTIVNEVGPIGATPEDYKAQKKEKLAKKGMTSSKLKSSSFGNSNNERNLDNSTYINECDQTASPKTGSSSKTLNNSHNSEQSTSGSQYDNWYNNENRLETNQNVESSKTDHNISHNKNKSQNDNLKYSGSFHFSENNNDESQSPPDWTEDEERQRIREAPPIGSSNGNKKRKERKYHWHEFDGENCKLIDKELAGKLLSKIQGHLVVFPTDWLYKEEQGNNWFYSLDRIPPLEIFD